MQIRRSRACSALGCLVLSVFATGVWYAAADPRPSFTPSDGGVLGVPTTAQRHVIWVAMPLRFTGTSTVTIDQVRLGPHAAGVRLLKEVAVDKADLAADLRAGHTLYDQGWGDPTITSPTSRAHFHPVPGWRLNANGDISLTDEVVLVIDVPAGVSDRASGVATAGMCVDWHRGLWSGTAHTGQIEVDYSPRQPEQRFPLAAVPRPTSKGC